MKTSRAELQRRAAATAEWNRKAGPVWAEAAQIAEQTAVHVETKNVFKAMATAFRVPPAQAMVLLAWLEWSMWLPGDPISPRLNSLLNFLRFAADWQPGLKRKLKAEVLGRIGQPLDEAMSGEIRALLADETKEQVREGRDRRLLHWVPQIKEALHEDGLTKAEAEDAIAHLLALANGESLRTTMQKARKRLRV